MHRFPVPLFGADGRAGGVSRVGRIGRGAGRSGCAVTVIAAGPVPAPDPAQPGPVDSPGSSRSRELSARSAVLSVRSSCVSCSRSRILPMPARLTPSATSSEIRRSRRRSSWLYRRVPPLVRPGRSSPCCSYNRSDRTATPASSAATEIVYTPAVGPGSPTSITPTSVPRAGHRQLACHPHCDKSTFTDADFITRKPTIERHVGRSEHLPSPQKGRRSDSATRSLHSDDVGWK